MATGQIFLSTPFGHIMPYYFYLVSIIVGMNIALLLWFEQNMVISTVALTIWIAIWVASTAVFATVHYLTFKKAIDPQLMRIFSFFLFGLLFVFASPKAYSPLSYNLLFFLTLVLFILNGVFCSNQLFRATIIKKELGFANRENYVSKTKDDLLKIPNISEKDVDLLVYYLKSSLNAFVQGDLEKSFMDAFKIAFDNHGKSFEGIYTLPEDIARHQHYANIRDSLSHAKHTPKNKNEQQKEKIIRLEEMKKSLYMENLKISRDN